jgi:membrane-associated phospholipid phosphatase
LQSTQYPNFKLAVLFCLLMVFSAALLLFIYGKTHSFILINGHYNPQLDHFFQYVTYLGDGLIYIPILLYALLFNRKFILPIIFAIIICTVLTHVLKRVVFPGELRPVSLEVEKVVIHKIEGVPLHRMHSFPSGHTSTAFSMALLLAAVMRQKIWAIVLPLIAFFVGYSRVYLAQHFVTDVLAGMTIGIVTAYLSLQLYKTYLKKRAQKQQALQQEPQTF